ncbi:hypothetical protein ASD98_18370 [Flavobacterium sp. Root186]|nr:hypothetical protein ASD98_18370 [Flavobacterium sp. Root186]
MIETPADYRSFLFLLFNSKARKDLRKVHKVFCSLKTQRNTKLCELCVYLKETYKPKIFACFAVKQLSL